MALTFGTLLSSQGADAHHRSPFGSLRGNLCYATRSVSQCQTDPARPALTDRPADCGPPEPRGGLPGRSPFRAPFAVQREH